ncbi:MAG: DUF86 domain-containing protein [Prevotellaceae bacterium]|jgi:uncharacterized protein with HEPN domain|nr:DUF86 domain-containing protein [Prevotellaceae bacterium]
MREQIRDKGRLEHILDSIERAFEFTNSIDFDEYKNNVMCRYAVVKCVEIIGEASYKLTHEFREQHSNVAWKKIIAMRHILVHGYYHAEDSEVWNVVKNDLPILKKQITEINEKY